MTTLSRNDPCPCGSGRKYKKCCIGQRVAAVDGPAGGGSMGPALVVAIVAVIGVLVWIGSADSGDTPPAATPVKAPTTPPAASPTAPITFPVTTPAAAGMPTRTGTPWEYDAGTNSHWDPSPGHQHWHSGPPPAK